MVGHFSHIRFDSSSSGGRRRWEKNPRADGRIVCPHGERKESQDAPAFLCVWLVGIARRRFAVVVPPYKHDELYVFFAGREAGATEE